MNDDNEVYFCAFCLTLASLALGALILAMVWL